jgi:hypothetical protein
MMPEEKLTARTAGSTAMDARGLALCRVGCTAAGDNIVDLSLDREVKASLS